MYVCLFVYMYVVGVFLFEKICMYTFLYVFMYVCRNVCIYVCMFVCIFVSMYVSSATDHLNMFLSDSILLQNNKKARKNQMSSETFF